MWFWGSNDDGSDFWFQIHTLSPTAMVGVDTDGDGETDSGAFVFPGQGVWLYDGDNNVWSQLHGFDASLLAAADLDGVPGQEVIADFPGYGLWVYGHGAWSQLHPFDVTSIITTDLDGNGRERSGHELSGIRCVELSERHDLVADPSVQRHAGGGG